MKKDLLVQMEGKDIICHIEGKPYPYVGRCVVVTDSGILIRNDKFGDTLVDNRKITIISEDIKRRQKYEEIEETQ